MERIVSDELSGTLGLWINRETRLGKAERLWAELIADLIEWTRMPQVNGPEVTWLVSLPRNFNRQIKWQHSTASHQLRPFPQQIFQYFPKWSCTTREFSYKFPRGHVTNTPRSSGGGRSTLICSCSNTPGETVHMYFVPPVRLSSVQFGG